MPSMTNPVSPASLVDRSNLLKAEGNAALKANDFTSAILSYTGAIDLLEDYQDQLSEDEGTVAIFRGPLCIYYANRAQVQLKLENFATAQFDAKKAIGYDPSYTKAYYRRAQANLQMAALEEALSDFRKVTKLCPSDKTSRKIADSLKKEIIRQKFSEAIAEEEIQPWSERLVIADLHVPKEYKGPGWEGDELPLTLGPEFLQELIDLFRREGRFPAKYASIILIKFINMHKEMPNVVHVEIPDDSKFTVCGDVHGQFYDLCNIFKLNGLPSKDNPFLFNGDFVDRGSWSVECALLLMTAKVICPDSVYLSRGNHETEGVNKLYGFMGECEAKFGKTSHMYKLFSEAFNWLPIAHVLDKEIFVVHGGLPSQDGVSIADICAVDRYKACTSGESNLFSDLLWADPQAAAGRSPSPRGVSNMFGPDVTADFLNTNSLKSVIRSHEVKLEGYELAHDGVVVTVFSAPNYCDSVGNKGAFIVFNKANATKTREFVTYTHVVHPACQPLQYASPFVKLGLGIK